jgi:hypothetical protein
MKLGRLNHIGVASPAVAAHHANIKAPCGSILR